MASLNARGSALTEGLPVITLLLIALTSLLLVSYLLFARAWIQYQSEQGLYCASEQPFGLICQHELEEHLGAFLFFGHATARLHGRGPWTVEVQWNYRDYRFNLRKTLDLEKVTHNKALL